MKHLSKTILSTFIISSSLFGATLSKNIQNSSLVVYNGGLGLVHEERLLELSKDDTSIVYEGVANTIDTDSVNVKLPNATKLKSQQYRFDKLTQSKLLDAHIGKSVEVRILKDSKNFKTLNAILLSYSSSNAIVKTANSKIITVQTKDIIFKNIPSELITKPSLVWNIEVDKDAQSNMEIDYLIKNISWKSDYILNLTKNTANLSGWISIDNRSGKSFKDTSLHVLAGDINLAREEMYAKNIAYSPARAQNDSVAHHSHEGYHLYSVPFQTNLANNEKTQIKFISKPNIHIQRKYSVTVQNPLYSYGNSKHNVTQFINIEALDVALPKGVVRTYSKLGKQNILLGQTNLKHTPKNTPIELKIGTNFDLKVEQTVIAKRDDKYRFNSTLEYKIKNSSSEEKTIELLVPFNSHKDSKIKTSTPYKMKHGNLVAFSITIAPESSEVFEVDYIAKK